SGVTGTGVGDQPGGVAAFEGVDGGLQHTAFGGDAAEDEVGPAVVVDEADGVVGEAGVRGLVDQGVGCGCPVAEVGGDVGLGGVLEAGPAHHALEGAVGVVVVAGEDDR